MKKGDPFCAAYKVLNRDQKKAVDTIDGPVMVIAGPGSGKTQVLSLRVAHILRETDATPGNILCLTFTESAASNMRMRLATLIGDRAYRVAIHTFHSFAGEIINRHPEYFFGGATMSPADDVVRLPIIEDAIRALPHGHPLRSEHPDQGFIFRRPVLRAIENAKKAGLMPEELLTVIKRNSNDYDAINSIIAHAIPDRVSMKTLSDFETCLSLLEKEVERDNPITFRDLTLESYWTVFRRALRAAYDEAKKEGKATPLSHWKTTWVERGGDGVWRVKDSADRAQRVEETARIYAHYELSLYARSYFDFDDMVLAVIRACMTYEPLVADLQETYQYILIDEFQDTNDAQMRLVRIIADAHVNEGRPNLMVVGDDDQAIYRFQGADSAHIQSFARMWKDVCVITMTDNYRSGETIVKAASAVIDSGAERVHHIVPGLTKELRAARKEKKGMIRHEFYPTRDYEYSGVAHLVKKDIEAGVSADTIAIIARKHRELVDLVPYLKATGVPIRYEREQNVFDEPHIREIILIARFVTTVMEKGTEEADYFLPTILSFPFWQLPRAHVWEVSSHAAAQRKKWLDVMRVSPHKSVRDIAEFLIDLSLRAKSEPLFHVLDRMIGAHTPLITDADDDDVPDVHGDTTSYVSPFKNYYFNPHTFTHARSDYLSFLSHLRTFIRSLREYKRGTVLSLHDLITFTDFHEKNNIALNDVSPFANAHHAVTLLTAHKAKGLEFHTVYVLSAIDDVWMGRGEPKRLTMPKNLPIEPAGDNDSDKVRLFYVALTRAADRLIFTSYETTDDGRKTQPIRFFAAGDHRLPHGVVPEKVNSDITPHIGTVLESAWLSFHTPPYVGEEVALLSSLVDDYVLSVTHLNNFLDVVHGGPQKFIENNLLRFPQAKTAHSAYGTAIHESMARARAVYLEKGKRVPLPRVVTWFDEALAREHIPQQEEEIQRDRGHRALSVFYPDEVKTFTRADRVEVDFRHEGVCLDGAILGGKIDVIVARDDGFTVIDYKTGKAHIDIDKGTDEERRKLYSYLRQLYFYRLLVENSRSYGGKKVTDGVIRFVEPRDGITAQIKVQLQDDVLSRIRTLAVRVYEMITTMTFPLIETYTKDMDGILAFENDICAGTCRFRKDGKEKTTKRVV